MFDDWRSWEFKRLSDKDAVKGLIEMAWHAKDVGMPATYNSAMTAAVLLSGSEAATPQPPPVGNGVEVDGFVIQDILERSEMGKSKYGTTLRTFNGRDALVDLYQELLDAVKYCKQALLERSAVACDRSRCQISLPTPMDCTIDCPNRTVL
jgi:hypothetical protein